MNENSANVKIRTIESFLGFLHGQGYPAWPLELGIDLGNVCDMACRMCCINSPLSQRKYRGSMPEGSPKIFADHQKILGAIQPLLEHTLFLHLLSDGEPTLHPGFVDVLTVADNHLVATDFITNGTRLTQELCEKLVGLQVFKVIISFSGATKKFYEHVYQGAIFENVLSGIKRLAQAKSATGQLYPLIQISSIGFEQHLDTLGDFVDLMASVGANLIVVEPLCGYEWMPDIFEQMVVYEKHKHEQLIDQARQKARAHNIDLVTESFEQHGRRGAELLVAARNRIIDDSPEKVRQRVFLSPDQVHSKIFDETVLNNSHTLCVPSPCLEPFKKMFIHLNGHVVPCVSNTVDQIYVASLATHQGVALWKSTGFQIVRREMLKGKLLMPFCTLCVQGGDSAQGHFADLLIEEYLNWFAARTGKPLAPEIRVAIQSLPTNAAVAKTYL